MTRNLLVVLAPAIGLLALGLFAFFQITRSAPAFSEDVRVESVTGDWRIPPSRALYDQGEYYMRLGYDYMRGDVVGVLTGRVPRPTPEEVNARIAEARMLFERSLAAGPGRLDAWTGLAWSSATLADLGAAEDALRVSWQLGPLSISEAPLRLMVLEGMANEGAIDQESRDAAAMDLAIIEAYDPRHFAYLQRERPLLFEFLTQQP